MSKKSEMYKMYTCPSCLEQTILQYGIFSQFDFHDTLLTLNYTLQT
jgi:hypothetical protein